MSDSFSPIIVEEIFQVALSLPEVERAAYLDQVCGEQPEVRAHVERKLEVHGIGALLRQGTDETVPPEIEAELARMKPEGSGDRIGHYKLLQQIGEGGFGVVWMAEQLEPVRRQVALKIIKLGMDTKEVIARFEQERQALALMDHSNIAKVFDAGATQHGRPYFVMELVRGIRITDYCDQNNLPTAERLGLFMAVCHAVQHAHQKGIIHRDIKPSNILVTLHDGVPVPKVIDFGVAKATQSQRLTDLTLFTQFEQMIGTPLYMSPEQAEMSGLDIDTRSDIYSLGVLLYELLTGQTPFDPKELMQAGHDEMRRVIREQEPRKPSTALSTMAVETRTAVAQHRQADPAKLAGMIRGDLDWIVMKALEKDRTRRYETANGFARDLARFLNHEPVEAGPPSAAYRLRKFARRHRAPLAAAAAMLALLVGGVITSTVQAFRAKKAEELAESRRVQSEARRVAAENAKAEAERELRRTSAIVDFMVSAFHRPNPMRDGRTVTMAAAARAAAAKLKDHFHDDPESKIRLLDALGKTFHGLGEHAESADLMLEALALARGHYPRDSEETLGLLNSAGTACNDAGRVEEAIRLHSEALDGWRRRGPESAPGLRDTLLNIGAAENHTGHVAKALKHYEEAMRLHDAHGSPDDIKRHICAVNLAAILMDNGRVDQALPLLEQAAARYAIVFRADHPDTLTAKHNLIQAYLITRNAPRAVELGREVLEERRRVLTSGHPDTLATIDRLASALSKTGQHKEALSLLREASADFKKLPPADGAIATATLADITLAAGDAAAAILLFDEALSALTGSLNAEHHWTLGTRVQLGEALRSLGRFDDAIREIKTVTDIEHRKFGADDPRTLPALSKLARTYHSAKMFDEAIAVYEGMEPIMQKNFAPDHPQNRALAKVLAELRAAANRKK
jgi:eukaryotic-like serine/threonine-protein kinase